MSEDVSYRKYVLFTVLFFILSSELNYSSLNASVDYYEIYLMDHSECQSCGYPTLPKDPLYEICYICEWQDEGLSEYEANMMIGGANDNYFLFEAQYNTQHYLSMYNLTDPRSKQTEGQRSMKMEIIRLYINLKNIQTDAEYSAFLNSIEEKKAELESELLISLGIIETDELYALNQWWGGGLFLNWAKHGRNMNFTDIYDYSNEAFFQFEEPVIGLQNCLTKFTAYISEPGINEIYNRTLEWLVENDAEIVSKIYPIQISAIHGDEEEPDCYLKDSYKWFNVSLYPVDDEVWFRITFMPINYDDVEQRIAESEKNWDELSILMLGSIDIDDFNTYDKLPEFPEPSISARIINIFLSYWYQILFILIILYRLFFRGRSGFRS